MRKAGALVALVLALAAVAGIALAFHPTSSAFSMQYARTGGFAGADDVLTIDNMGRVTYSSRFGESFNVSLTQAQLADLKNVLATSLDSVRTSAIPPKSGVADFFSYDLTVDVGGTRARLSWVDGWAAAEPLPPELQAIQQALQAVIAGMP